MTFPFRDKNVFASELVPLTDIMKIKIKIILIYLCNQNKY